jgi:uncharacterized protein YlzI (FlbEa/FlbD family)
MFSPIFICLSHHTGKTIWLNVSHIVSFSKVSFADDGFTYVHCLDDAQGEARMVSETPDEIIERIIEATEFPNN